MDEVVLGDVADQVATGGDARTAVEVDGAAGRSAHPGERVEQRGFAGPAGSEDRDDLPRFDDEVDAVENGTPVADDTDPVGFDPHTAPCAGVVGAGT